MAGERYELNTILMRSTFKLVGKGSIGTAFVLGKPVKDEGAGFYYTMVTAAHVLERMEGDKAAILLRKHAGDSFESFPWELEIRRVGNPLWFRHPDTLVDVAAMYISLPRDADIQLLATDLLCTDDVLKQFEIHPGDELMCLGYPFGSEANESGFPILRSGKIASYPLIPTRQTKTFLLDFEIFPGNSGGPVYFAQSGRTYAGGMHVATIQFIAGLVSHEYRAIEKTETQYEKVTRQHPLGLARIVHASLVQETIDLLPPPDGRK